MKIPAALEKSTEDSELSGDRLLADLFSGLSDGALVLVSAVLLDCVSGIISLGQLANIDILRYNTDIVDVVA